MNTDEHGSGIKKKCITAYTWGPINNKTSMSYSLQLQKIIICVNLRNLCPKNKIESIPLDFLTRPPTEPYKLTRVCYCEVKP